MKETDEILALENVTPAAGSILRAEVSTLNLEVRYGELAIVTVEAHHDLSMPFCDIAEGLVPVSGGSVRFLGKAWDDMSPFVQTQMRGKIGRVFSRAGWISNIGVYENIALSQRHHTLRSESEIRNEAEILCRAAGLEEIPDALPDLAPPVALKQAEWVRAFMGRPRLVLLEHAEHRMPADRIACLEKMIAAARSDGTAVVWLTADPGVREAGKRAGARVCRLGQEKI